MTEAAGWYPVGLSAGIEAGTSAGTRVEGVELVVWRDSSGGIHVWEDRCPHRGMKMSFGFVRGDHIACLYHGWQYDAAGQCRLIPARPDLNVPDAIRIGTYPVEERCGIVWAALGTAGVLPEDRETLPVRSLYIERDAGAIAVDLTAQHAEALGDRLYRLAMDEQIVLVALQPVDKATTAQHIVVDAITARDAGGGRKAAFAWAQRYRMNAEAAR